MHRNLLLATLPLGSLASLFTKLPTNKSKSYRRSLLQLHRPPSFTNTRMQNVRMRDFRTVAISVLGGSAFLASSCVDAYVNVIQQRHAYSRHLGTNTRRHHRHQLSAAGSNALEGFGMPSNPGWESGRLNRLTEWADSAQPNRPIICEYDPKGLWLWRKWNGTVLKATWGSVLLSMLAGFFIDFYARGCSLSNYKLSWDLAAVPSASEPFIKRLLAIGKVWEYQLTLSTFILTFFLSHAFSYWQKVYNTTRMIQGRINDFCMLLTMGAERGIDNEDDTTKKPRSNAATVDKGSRGFSKRAENFVKLCTRFVRLSHTFFWAQTATSSNGLNDCDRYLKAADLCTIPVDDEHIGPLLLSPYGLRALVDAGQLTKEEREGLMGSGLPPSQYAYVLLVWVGIHVMDGLKNGTLRGGPGFEENILRQLATLRACYFDIDDFRAGRMPLAYVQLVQVLVDSLVVISPFALYPSVGILSIPLVGLLALFFRGLLALSKSFLDPFGVEGYEEQCLHVDVLVSELNFGAARRWINAAGFVPLSRTNDEEIVHVERK